MVVMTMVGTAVGIEDGPATQHQHTDMAMGGTITTMAGIPMDTVIIIMDMVITGMVTMGMVGIQGIIITTTMAIIMVIKTVIGINAHTTLETIVVGIPAAEIRVR